MPKYKKFTAAQVFKADDANHFVDNIYTALSENSLHFDEAKFLVAGSVAQNMQELIDGPVHDIDMIITDEQLWEDAKKLELFAGYPTEYRKDINRIFVDGWVLTMEIFFEKQPPVTEVSGIKQKLYAKK